MGHEVLLHTKANKFLEKSDEDLHERIKKKLETLRSKPGTGKKLKVSFKYPLKGEW